MKYERIPVLMYERKTWQITANGNLSVSITYLCVFPMQIKYYKITFIINIVMQLCLTVITT